MKHLHSDLNSENKKDGMKFISNAVYSIIKNNEGVTYTYICDNISLNNKKTLHRRIYDVLNVMKAVKIIEKKNKKFYITSTQEIISKKKEELARLNDMKNTFEFLIHKNANLKDEKKDKLFLPFMVIKTQQDALIHCDTNEERSFFSFKSNKKIEIVEDLEILKELFAVYKNNKELNQNQKETHNNIYF